MPTYEYVCEKCGHQFDFFQSIKDEALKTCPKEKCAMKRWGKGKVTKSISAGAGLIFKGSGFYITDYRSENYKQAAKKDSAATESKPASGSSGESKSSGSTAKASTPKSDKK
ncbi:MAG: FmdB family zinc ribbon protein [Verrucomicrobiota bacterium]|jgi:putative FmdB family regulatory protein